MSEVPAVGILGFGYLGRPLAERAYQAGAEVAAIKRHISSDDINLPIALEAVRRSSWAYASKILGRKSSLIPMPLS